MKTILLILILLLTNTLLISAQHPFLNIKLSISEPPPVNTPAVLTCTFSSSKPWGDTVANTAWIEMYNNTKYEIVEGSMNWDGKLKANVPVTFNVTIIFKDTGNIEFAAFVKELGRKNYSYMQIYVGETYGQIGFKEYKIGRNPDTRGLPNVTIPHPSEIKRNEEKTDSSGMLNKSIQGTIIVKGQLKYVDRNSSIYSSGKFVKVYLWDKDDFSSDDFLGVYTITDADGNWQIDNVPSNDIDDINVDIYAVYQLESNIGRVETYSQVVYQWDTWASHPVNDVVDGSTVDLETYYINDINKGAMWIYQTLYDAYSFTPNIPGSCTIQWEQTGGPNISHFSSLYNHIELMPIDKSYPDVIVHEIGHNYMFNAYGLMPVSNCPDPHIISAASNVVCAWTEGWATFFALAVYNDNIYNHPDNDVDMELPSAAWSWDNTDNVEGRVACALWDLYDTPNDGCDQYGYGFDKIWNIIYTVNNNTFADFWNSWKSFYPTDKRDATSCIEQNTIFYYDDPVINSIANQSLDMNTTKTVDLSSSSNVNVTTDTESSQSDLSFNIISNSNQQHCPVSISNGKMLNINPSQDWSGQTTVTLQASDICKNSISKSFIITVNSLPILNVNPLTIDVDGSAGQSQINVSNPSTGTTLNWNVSVTQGWLTVNPASGVNNGTFNINYETNNSGTITACKVVVANPGWCDYVFDDKYKLPSLSEVEQFVKQHKHLPDVPSEKEVTENGIDVGQMNTILLKKIEELTLYSIEQQKQINELKKEMSNFKK